MTTLVFDVPLTATAAAELLDTVCTRAPDELERQMLIQSMRRMETAEEVVAALAQYR